MLPVGLLCVAAAASAASASAGAASAGAAPVLVEETDVVPGSSSPGVRFTVSPHAFTVLTEAAEVFGPGYVHSLEPLHLPNQSSTHLDTTVTLENMEVKGVSWKSVSVTPSSGGVMGSIGGFAAQLAYTVAWDAPLGIKGSESAVGSLSDSDFDAFVSIRTGGPDGRVAVALESARPTKLTIRNFKTGLKGVGGKLLDLLSGVIQDVLDREVPKSLAPIVNADIAKKIAQIPVEVLIADNKTRIDLTVPEVTVSKTNGISIGFDGTASPVTTTEADLDAGADATATATTTTTTTTAEAAAAAAECPFRHTVLLGPTHSRDVEIAIGDSTVQCMLWALQVSGGLHALAASELASLLPLDGRLAFGVDFPFLGTTELTFDSKHASIAAELGATLYWDRLIEPKERFITIAAGARAVVGLSVSQYEGNHSIVATADVKELTMNELNVTQRADDIPEQFKRQIDDTDYAKLEAEANAFIASTVLPAAAADLTNVAVVPKSLEFIQTFLRKASLSFAAPDFTIGFDLTL